jgi:hypothetical protein
MTASVEAIVHRLEDAEDDMKVCQNDLDVLKLEQASMGRDIGMLEASMGSVHEQLENLGNRMDGCVAASRRTASIVEGNARFLATVRSGQVEVCELAEDLNRKFTQINEVIDRKMVRQDEELDRVVRLFGKTLGAEGVLPGRHIVSLLRVFKQFTHLIPSGQMLSSFKTYSPL